MTKQITRIAWLLLASLFLGGLLWGRGIADEVTARGEVGASDRRREEIAFLDKGRPRRAEGRLVIEAADGGLLFEAQDGVLWSVENQEVLARRPVDATFKALTASQLAERLVSEMPPGFRTHITPHYVVCYNTSRAYAQWTSSLLERLHKAFTNYWQNQGLELRGPEFPLPVLVFADRQSYEAASREDLPGGTGNIVGFYSLRSNRINMFDLTGAQALNGRANRRGSLREINQMLSQPAAEPLVATIVHEATHQIAFNCGMMQRYADLPLWLCEGMAVYFEAPDLTSARGWRGIGKVNYARLERFQKNLPNWNDTTLQDLLTTDSRFRDPQSAVDAYADAWALNYYLIRYRNEAYTGYLRTLGQRRPLVKYEPHARLEDFLRHFGDMADVERDFLKQMTRLK